MTTILFHAQDDDELEPRLQHSLALVRASGAHLSCLHVTPADAFVTFDAFGGVFVMDKVMDAVMDVEARVRDRVSTILSNEDVPWDYQQVGGPIAATLTAHASLADLLVLGRQKATTSGFGDPLAIASDLLNVSRVPIFIPGDSLSVHDPLAPAIIGWNGSHEAANAVRGSLGWLKLARSVMVVSVAEPRRHKERRPSFPSIRLLEYLSRHDIHAELREHEECRSEISSLLVEEAWAHGAGTVVIGGYGHSRIGEYWVGGVTRDLLEACPVGLIVAH